MSKSKPKEKSLGVNRGIPKFYGLRIYLISTLLFFLLVIPFLLFLGYRSIPEINEKRNLFGRDTTGLSDSLLLAIDSLSTMEGAAVDSLVNNAILLGESIAQAEAEARAREEAGEESDTAVSGGPRVEVSLNKEEDHDSPFDEKSFVPTYFKLLFTLLIASFLRLPPGEAP